MNKTTKGVCLMGCSKQVTVKNSTEHLHSCERLNKTLADKADKVDGYLLRVQCAYRKNMYWLMLAAPGTSTLKDLDRFLRAIWLECCGHLSRFEIPNASNKSAFKISQLKVGDKFRYDYDFGNTTTLLIHVEGGFCCPSDKKITLLLRNVPPELACFNCYVGQSIKAIRIVATIWQNDRLICDRCREDNGDLRPKRAKTSRVTSSDLPTASSVARAIADEINGNEEGEHLCEEDAKGGEEKKIDEAEVDENDEEDEIEHIWYVDRYLPLVNSPRTGECGYTGTNRSLEHDDSVDII